jgi:hypothetical protein
MKFYNYGSSGSCVLGSDVFASCYPRSDVSEKYLSVTRDMSGL